MYTYSLIWQFEAAASPANHFMNYVEAFNHVVAQRHVKIVVLDDAEASAKHRGDMQRRIE